MKNKANVKEMDNYDYKKKRIFSLLVDYVIWYLIYAVMILVFYFNIYGSPEVSGDLLYYRDAFDNIIKTPVFSLGYLGIICILEIIIPLLTNGQSITKKIFKIKILSENNSKIRLLVRSVFKILILNPYGVVAYIIGELTNTSYVNTISNILSVIFVISVILAFKNNKSIHDKIAKTNVEMI